MHLFVLFCLICKSERSRIPNSREIDSFRDSFLAGAPGHSFANRCDAIRQLMAGLTGEGTRSAFTVV